MKSSKVAFKHTANGDYLDTDGLLLEEIYNFIDVANFYSIK